MSRTVDLQGPIPPLPDLDIDNGTRQYTDQDTVDRALRSIYEHKPDLFQRMAEREQSKEGGPYDEFVREFRRFTREELKITGLSVATSIFWEARRRARVMYGMPI